MQEIANAFYLMSIHKSMLKTGTKLSEKEIKNYYVRKVISSTSLKQLLRLIRLLFYSELIIMIF